MKLLIAMIDIVRRGCFQQYANASPLLRYQPAVSYKGAVFLSVQRTTQKASQHQSTAQHGHRHTRKDSSRINRTQCASIGNSLRHKLGRQWSSPIPAELREIPARGVAKQFSSSCCRSYQSIRPGCQYQGLRNTRR
jgi:hypothetical protein